MSDSPLQLLTLREADVRLGLRVGTLASEFYYGRLPDSVCAIVGGATRRRRVIPVGKLFEIAELLKRKAK